MQPHRPKRQSQSRQSPSRQSQPRPPRPPRAPRRRPRPADPNRRMRIGLVLMLFVISLFAGRLVQLQGLDAPALAATALANRTKVVNLPAHRGDITDASGAVLATTVERRNLYVDQTLAPEYRRLVGHQRIPVGLTGAAEDLAPLLGTTTAQMTARLTGKSRYAALAKGVTPDVARQVIRLMPAVTADQADIRVYPGGELAANLLGFVAKDGHSVGGLEQGLDSTLQGSNGSITYEVGEDGTQIPTGVTDEKDPTGGGTVRLTIDRDLQWTAQQMLAEQVAATQSDYGSIAVIDPHTGAILALATAPTFDPNNPGKARPQDTGDRPLLDVFEPGSTSKVVTLSAALEEKAAAPLTQVTVPNTLRRADRTFHDAESHGTEKLTVAGVLAQSSNIGTILTGEKVPPATMERYLRGFGLGAKADVGLPESSGRLDPAASWSDSQRFTVLFGQGLSVNVLQSAQVFATLANDGVRVAPQLIAGWTDAAGTWHPGTTGTSTRVVSAGTATQMRQMMEGVVVEGGTAVKAAVPGYRVAGKTGTAERYLDSCSCYSGYTASFIGMAPADHPALVIAVVLQNPQRGHFGGEVAAPVFSKLMTYALARRAVPPSSTPAPQIPTRWR